MDAGALDREIELKSVTVGTDSETGDETESEVSVANVMAKYKPMTSKERFSAARDVSEDVGTFRIWWRSDVNKFNRIVYDSKTWEITGVAEVGRKEGLDLTAEVKK